MHQQCTRHLDILATQQELTASAAWTVCMHAYCIYIYINRNYSRSLLSLSLSLPAPRCPSTGFPRRATSPSTDLAGPARRNDVSSIVSTSPRLARFAAASRDARTRTRTRTRAQKPSRRLLRGQGFLELLADGARLGVVFEPQRKKQKKASSLATTTTTTSEPVARSTSRRGS